MTETLTELGSGLAFRTLLEPRQFGEGFQQWAVVGPRGAVSLTGLVMPAGYAPRYTDLYVPVDGRWLMPADLGWHSATEAEGWQRMDCDLLLAGECWYTGSSLQAGPPLQTWAARGHDTELLQAYLVAQYGQEWPIG